MSKLFFSIIIPTYNRAGFIAKTINSVLNQTYANFELIVVDDGSTDNTKEIIASIDDKRIKYYWKENAERGAARNYGIKKAKGDYIFFIDSDDIMLSNHLTTLYQMIKLNPKINFFSTKYYIERNGIKKRATYPNVPTGIYGIKVVLKGNPFGSMICIKKSNPNLIMNLENRKYSIMEDWLFLLCNLINDKILIESQATLVLIDHPNRSMRSNNSVIIKKRLLANEWAIKNIVLSENEKQILTAYSYYFCAVHAIIDKSYDNAKKHIRKAKKEIGNISEFIKFEWKLKLKRLLHI